MSDLTEMPPIPQSLVEFEDAFYMWKELYVYFRGLGTTIPSHIMKIIHVKTWINVIRSFNDLTPLPEVGYEVGIKQTIRDEPRRRMDQAPGKRATE